MKRTPLESWAVHRIREFCRADPGLANLRVLVERGNPIAISVVERMDEAVKRVAERLWGLI